MTTTNHIRQGYKYSPVGPIPIDWDVKYIHEIAADKKGAIKIGPFGSQLKKEEFVLDGVKVYDQETTFKNDFFIGKNYITNNKYEDLKSCEIHPGDIIISMMGTIGAAAIVPENAPKGILNSHLLRIRANNKIIQPQYLKISISDSPLTQKQLKRKSHGGIMSGLSAEIVKSVQVSIPPLPEQTAIANLLGMWDKAIQTTITLVAQKEQRKKWLMQQLLTGRKRLKGFEKIHGFHKTDFSLKIPKDWNIVTIEDIFVERNERSSDQTKYPLFSLTIENGLTEKTDRYERRFLLKDQENNQYKIVRLDDILFNPMNLRFGAIAKSGVKYPVSVSAYYNVITKSKEYTNIKFYENLFRSELYNHFYERIAIGSLNEKKRVHLSNFFKLQVPLPSIEEQTAIADVLKTADRELQLLKAKGEYLKEQKKGLMQVLLTGKKRLKINNC